MAEGYSIVKGSSIKNKKDIPRSRSFLQCSSTPLSSVSSARLSLVSSGKLQKITSNSLERLSFISEKDENSELENYHLEYSTYLLRKLQNQILTKNKEENEEKVKKCFVSLKYELEDSLDKYVKLSRDIGYYKISFGIIRQSQRKIEEGRKILKLLKENEFDVLMKSLSNSLEHRVNQLQLIDIDKKLIDEAFSNNIWGSGSKIEECLKKIESCISKNKNEVSNIAELLVEIKALSLENTVLRKRFESSFQQISNEIVETNYNVFTDIVKRAFEHREDCKSEFTSLSLDFDTDFLKTGVKTANSQLSFHLSKMESDVSVMPNSSSTPQQI